MIDPYFGCEKHREYVGGPLWNHHIAHLLSYEFRKVSYEMQIHPKLHLCYSKGQYYGLSQCNKWIKIK